MTNWTRKRKASFFIHAGFVAIPFGLSTGAALVFWHDLFGVWGLSALMVCSVEILAFTGLVLSIARIPSPFVWLRHVLPFVSVVPLGRELYALLAHNGPGAAWAVTIITVSILVCVAWMCYEEIERQFIPPIEAARERARAQFENVRLVLAQLDVMDAAADAFVVERMQYHAPRLTAARVQEAYPAPVPSVVTTETTRRVYECPNCGNELAQSAYGAAKKYGYCKACKEG